MKEIKTLTNSVGKIVAKIQQDGNGVLYITSFTGKIWGTYDPKTNITKKWAGQIVGYGNLLATLIENE